MAKEPISDKKDLGIKVNTPVGAKWERIVEAQEGTLINNEVNGEIAKVVLEYARKRVEEEKQKL